MDRLWFEDDLPGAFERAVLQDSALKTSRMLGLALVAVLAVATAAAAQVAPGGTFEDDNGSVHEGNIEAIAAEGITQGCNPPANTLFCPSDPVTREQMAGFLVRAMNYTDNGGGDHFIDDNTSIFEDAIDRLRTAAVTLGCNPPSNDRYCPDSTVTRGQMAAFLDRAMGYTDNGGGNHFIDDDSSIFENAIDRLHTAGVTLGCNPPINDRFCPDNEVTREQMASFLARALSLTPIQPPTPPPAGTRDPLLWPYPADSIWNHPLGNAADLVPFRMKIPSQKTLNVEEDIIITRPNAPRRDIMSHDAAWNDGVTRCGSRTGEVEIANVPIPSGWNTDPGYHGVKPNHSSAILLPDMTLVETQPFHICPDGVAVSQFSAKAWQGDSILTGGMATGKGGSHGGSGMTAFGGTIRLGEWVPGGEIPHAVKIEVYGIENLSPTGGGYRWPALNADKGYLTKYAGTVPEAKMGALLALPPSFDISSLDSEPARILARALQRYGAYVVDQAGWSAAALAVEWGPNGRVKTEFQQVWGYPMDGHRPKASSPAHQQFLADMEEIYKALHIVNDNTRTSIGGAGTRLAPWAPPFADGSGGR